MNTTETPEHHDSSPLLGLGSSEVLGVPLPEPAFRTTTTGGAFDHNQVRAYGAACVAAAYHSEPTGWLVQYERHGPWEWVAGESKPDTIAADFEPLYQRRSTPNVAGNRLDPVLRGKSG
jgi:hypothetical protein